MLHTIGKAIVTVGVFFGSLFGYQQPQAVQQPVPQLAEITDAVLGAFNPSGGGTYRLQSSVSSSASSVTLSSFKEPVSNIPYTMTHLNTSIAYGTIEPLNNTKKEFISFTGITQNSDGTATLSGVSRGLSFSYPFTASTTLQQTHAGQSIFILSNSPQFYDEFLIKKNSATSTGDHAWSSTTPPRYDFVPPNHALGSAVATTAEFASLAYVNNVATSGSPNASLTVKGLVEFATGAEAGSSTPTGGTGAGLALYSLYATSSQYTSGSWIPVSMANGKLRQDWLDLTESFTLSGGLLSTGSTTISTATTTVTGGLRVATSTSLSGYKFLMTGSGYLTGGLSIGTASTTGNGVLVVSNVASTTDLVVSGTCTGCPLTYTASSTIYSVAGGSTTYTGSIPSWANTGIIKYSFTENQGNITLTRSGNTTTQVGGWDGTNAARYAFTWSGNDLVVAEEDDGGTITGTAYWYK